MSGNPHPAALIPASQYFAMTGIGAHRSRARQAERGPGSVGCGGHDGIRTHGLQITVPLRLPPPRPGLWSGLSLHHGLPATGAACLVSTPSSRFRLAWLGIGHRFPGWAFPEFKRFSAPRFRNALPIKSPLLYQLSYVPTRGASTRFYSWRKPSAFKLTAKKQSLENGRTEHRT